MVNLSALLIVGLTTAQAATSPPWFPSPEVGTVVTDLRWKAALEKAQQTVANMTLPEKVNVTTGVGWEMGMCVGNTGAVERLGIKSFCLQDGPLGVRLTDKVTVFPAGISMASTFSRDLVFRRGAAMGRENKRKGVDIHLGPVVGPLGRQAQGGRNWEGLSADCYLAGKLAAQSILGTQSENVMAVVKHLVGNEQEHFRQLVEWKYAFNYTNLKEQISANIDDRAMNEAYLWPFADAVRANVGSVMCSYQQVNGTSSCHNSELLNGKLKHEMGFQGFVMSDWFAHQTGVAAAVAGLDMSMPGNDFEGNVFWGANLTTMVLNGTLDESRLDGMVTRILTPLFYVKTDDRRPNFSSFTDETKGPALPYLANLGVTNQSNVTVNYHVDARDGFTTKTALESAQAALVLLKNDDGLLPLLNPQSTRVFGVGSQIGPNGPVCAENLACSDGALITGWGSGSVYPTEYQSPYEALRIRAAESEAYVSGTSESWDLSVASDMAADADVNVIYVLSDSGESTGTDGNDGDRKNVSLWHNGDELIKAVASRNRNNIVVVTTVGPVDLEPWIGHPNVSAVLLTGPAGDFGGQAAASVIFGDYNPSAKLPYTIAKNSSDYIPIVLEVPEDGKPQEDFSEGTLIDYKWYDQHNITPRYEFGFGLSFSNFTFTDLDLNIDEESISELLSPPPAALNVSRPSTNLTAAPSVSDAQFPDGYSPIPGFVYPWIESNVTITKGKPYETDTSNSRVSTASGGVGGNPMLWSNAATVSHTVANNGPHRGSAVSQLYISFPQSQDFATAPRQLRGFDKTPILEVGETHVAHYDVNWRDLAVWDPVIQSWRVQRGEYQIAIGHSSRDLILVQSFIL